MKKLVMLYFGFICKIQVDHGWDWSKVKLMLFGREGVSSGLDYRYFKVPKTDLMFISIKLLLLLIKLFDGVVNQEKALSLKSSQDHCQRFSLLQISKMLRVGFIPVESLSSDFFGWRYTAVIITNLQCYKWNLFRRVIKISVKITLPKYYKCYYI